MARIHVSSSRDVDAPPDAVYAVVTDYTRRPEWLPDAFGDYGVDEGGAGAGTRFHYTLQAGRRQRTYHMTASELGGHLLREQDRGSSLTTTWSVAPQGPGSRIEVVTEWDGAGGVGGFFERTFAPTALRRIYDDMLMRLAAVAGRSSAQ